MKAIKKNIDSKEITESNEVKESNETKVISFRVPMEISDALDEKALSMGLSKHELLYVLVQQNYQVPTYIPKAEVKETVTTPNSTKVMLPLPSKQVFRFNWNEMRNIQEVLCYSYRFQTYLMDMKIGQEINGLTRIAQNEWEVEIKNSYEFFK